MTNINFIKTLTAGVVLALAICPQVFAADTGSCGTNCQYTYENETLTFSPIDSSQEAVISEPVPYYGLSGQVKNAIINEGITDVLYNNNGWYSTLSGTGKADGKLVIPSTMRSFGGSAAGGLCFGTVEINSNNMSFDIEAFGFDSNTNVNIIMSADSNFTFDEKTMYKTYTKTYQYPASLTIACKGNPDTCLEKFGNSLAHMTGEITTDYYQEIDSNKNVTLQYFDDGYRQLNDQGYYDVYDLADNHIGYSNLDGTKQYDEKGNIIAKYDTDGNLLAQYGYAADGSVYTYDGNHNLIGAKKTSPFTPAEAAALVKKGNNNTVTLTFK